MKIIMLPFLIFQFLLQTIEAMGDLNSGRLRGKLLWHSISREILQYQSLFYIIYQLIQNSPISQYHRTPKNMPSIISSILLLLLSINKILTLYDVPSYYGHFSQYYFQVNKIQSGRFRYFEYHFAADMDYTNNTVYFADNKLNCIYQFELSTKRKTVLAGTCGKAGNRVGGLSVMLFNGCSSVAYFRYNQQAKVDQNNMKMYIVANQTCSLSDSGCILPDKIAASTTLTTQNLRLSPLPTQFPVPSNQSQQYLYVSDTENHCIKRINLGLKTSTVVAGKCGQSGFMDGPFGFNRLNKPSNLGITKQGALYIWDSGNQYMRKIRVDGKMETLLNGACKFYGKSRQINGYWLNNILCYDNWIEGTTKADIQHVINNSEINICTQHSSKC